jgi:hypothetical protein
MSEWISVKDRLPEPTDNSVYKFSDAVLICVKGTQDQYVATLWTSPHSSQEWEVMSVYRSDTCESCTDRLDFNQVTHWMPLPEPPEEL